MCRSKSLTAWQPVKHDGESKGMHCIEGICLNTSNRTNRYRWLNYMIFHLYRQSHNVDKPSPVIRHINNNTTWFCLRPFDIRMINVSTACRKSTSCSSSGTTSSFLFTRGHNIFQVRWICANYFRIFPSPIHSFIPCQIFFVAIRSSSFFFI